jgi:hypothetical protein
VWFDKITVKLYGKDTFPLRAQHLVLPARVQGWVFCFDNFQPESGSVVSII